MIAAKRALRRALCRQRRAAAWTSRPAVSCISTTSTTAAGTAGSGGETGNDTTTGTPEVVEAQIIEDHDDEPAPMPMQDRTVKELYRDCIRLTYHLGGISKKGDAMRQMVGWRGVVSDGASALGCLIHVQPHAMTCQSIPCHAMSGHAMLCFAVPTLGPARPRHCSRRCAWWRRAAAMEGASKPRRWKCAPCHLLHTFSSSLLKQVRAQFGKYVDETDPEVIEDRRQDAVRGLSNYLIFAQHGGQQGLEKLSRGDKSGAE